MDRRVGRIYKLAGNKAVGDFLRQLICFGDGALHALRAFRQHDLRAVGFQDIAAFHAHGLRHGEDDTVSFGRRDSSQTDAGVTGGGFDDDRARFQLSFRFRVFDHRLGNAVLHAACRVKIFQLHQDRSFQA